ncbi:MAG TPA: Flp pilus assembly protein CpaB [Pirellulales bacterium]|jgi:pilus assembly protein CpaB|nr:Flp pilus assembly protein CpaB [Pirellulales bacterium]
MKRVGPGTITLAVCAILFGLVAAYAAKQYLTPKVREDRGVPVLVAKFNLPQNSRLVEQSLEVVKKSPEQVPPGAMNSSARALMRVNKVAILAGQPITEDQLFGVGYSPTLSQQIPPGMRAVTFAVDQTNALGGILGPQAIVDVSLTVKGEQPELHGMTTKTILYGVKVLATSEGLYKVEERPNPSLKNVTVAVSPEQANKLILAQRFGTLSVTLRGADDSVVAAENRGGDEVNPQILLGLKPIEPKPPEALTKTQVWRGASMTELTFKDNRVQEEKPISVAGSPLVEPLAPIVSTSYQRPEPPARDGNAKHGVVSRGRGE